MESSFHLLLLWQAFLLLSLSPGPVPVARGQTSGPGLWKQGPATTCEDEKKKIICLPKDYSKFDLPYRNDFNVIDIGESRKAGCEVIKSNLLFYLSHIR